MQSYLSLSILSNLKEQSHKLHSNKDTKESISFLNLTLIKATIKESLESTFSIECNGFIESMQKNFLLETNLNNSNNSKLQPKDLINCLAILNIYNPFHKDSKTLYFNHSHSNTQTTYKGIITHLQYLDSFQQNNTNTLKYRHNFTLTLQSPLIRLSLNNAYRIYTDITPIDAIKHTLRFYEGYLEKAIDFSQITQAYTNKEIISQYNESDLDFITRIAHNHGIYFYEDSDTIYFCDSFTAKPTKNVAYNPNAINNALHEECIHHFSKEENLHNNLFAYSSNDANTPINIFSSQIYTKDEEAEQSNNITSFTHTYDSGYSFTQSIDTKKPLFLKAKRLQMLDATLKAQSNIYHLSLADLLTIDYEKYYADNNITITNKEFIITDIEQTLIDNALLTQYSTAQDTTTNNTNNKSITSSKNQNITTHSYSNTIKLIPSHISYIPDTKAKPKAPLHTQGIVVGEGYIRAQTQEEAKEAILKEYNTIYTDEYGRVRVRMNMYANQEERDNHLLERMQKGNLQDSDSQNNYSQNPNINISNTNITSSKDNSTKILSNQENTTAITNTNTTQTYSSNNKRYSYTPFLRVSSPIASNFSGFFHTPRIGDEVIISFLDDDIDKPFISSSLYNQSNPSLVNLPFNDHQTSLSSKTIGTNEEGHNEITLSNIKDNEEIYIRAQKDYKEYIKHNFHQSIQNNKDSKIEGSYTESITKYHKQEVLGLKDVRVGGEYLTNVALSKDTIIGLSNTLNVGVDNKVRIANNSSEYVGGDKEVEIGGKLQSHIERYKIETINDNSTQIVQGYNNIQTNKDLQIDTQGETLIKSKDNIHVHTPQSLSLSADANSTLLGDSIHTIANSNIYTQAQNQITHKVGDTQIIAKGDSIILKAGGIEVIIDSNGLIVKGGEIKAE